MSLFQLTLTLFLIMDAPGNLPVFMTLLKDFTESKKRKIVLREMLFALIIMIACCFLGKELLQLLHVSTDAVNIAGGVILFFIALYMLFPKNFPFLSSPSKESDPFIVPLAIPIIAGPALIGSLLIFATTTSLFSLSLAVLLSWFFTTLVLLSISWASKVLGPKVLGALEKVMGFVMALLAIEMLSKGIMAFVH